MPLRFPSALVAFRTLTAAVLAYSIFWWSVWAPGVAFDGSECLAVLRLVWCALVLSLVGQATTTVTARFCSRSAISNGHENESSLARLPYMSNAIIALAIGQLVTMSWVFARSALSGIAYALIGRQLPITTIEITLLLIGAGLIVLRIRRPALSRHSTLGVISFLAVLVCIVAPLVFRDLPRSVALSSDPDQHAFWAAQVFTLGIVPWDQGLTGVGPFGYPAGFAVLNAVWMAFSGFSAVEIVTIQPMLQFLLAVVLCAAVGPLLGRLRRPESESCQFSTLSWPVALTALLGVFMYWYLLPYGLQNERIHGEGTPRLSTSLLYSGTLILWMLPAYSTRNNRWGVSRVLAVTATVLMLVTMNPIAAVIPAVFAALVILRYSFSEILSGRCGRLLGAVAATLLLASLLLGGEPYVLSGLANVVGASNQLSADKHASSILSLSNGFTALWTGLTPARVTSYLLAGVYQKSAVGITALAVIGVAFLLCLCRSRRFALLWLVSLILCGALPLLPYALHSADSSGLPLYLIKPYMHESALQLGVILSFLLLTAVLVVIFNCRGIASSVLAIATVAVSLLTPQQSVSAASGAFTLEPRECRPASPTCATSAEHDALVFVEQFTSQVITQYPHLSYATAPKILILGVPVTRGRERWVFPTSASRAVPLYSRLPVAFFYGRGHSDWSFDNYVSRVCKKRDDSWLRERNIRYLFLSSRDHGCMKHRREVVRRGRIVFEKDGVRLVQLF